MNLELTTQKICLILTAGLKTLIMKLSVSRLTPSSHVVFVFTAQRSLFCFFLPAKAQKVEMDKLEKAKKERTKVRVTTKKRGFLCCQVLFSVCVRGKSPPAALNFYFMLLIRHSEISTAKFRSCNISSGPAPGRFTAQLCPFSVCTGFLWKH